MINLIYRIITESMSGENGRFSSKKLTMWQYSQLGFIMIITDLIANHGQLNTYAFPIVVGMALGVSILSTADQKINNSDPKSPEPDKKITKTETLEVETKSD